MIIVSFNSFPFSIMLGNVRIKLHSWMGQFQSHMFHSFAEMYQMSFSAKNVDTKRKFLLENVNLRSILLIMYWGYPSWFYSYE